MANFIAVCTKCGEEHVLTHEPEITAAPTRIWCCLQQPTIAAVYKDKGGDRTLFDDPEQHDPRIGDSLARADRQDRL